MRFAGIKLSNYMDSPDFGLQAMQVSKSQSNERKAEGVASYEQAMAESMGRAQYEGYDAAGQAQVANAESRGNAAAFGGAMDGIGSFAGAVGKKYGNNSGGNTPSPVGSQGNPSFPSSMPPGSFPGGPAIGGGRLPLNG